MTVLEYPLSIFCTSEVTMPFGAKPLCVQLQRGVPTLWALVDPLVPAVPHEIHVVSTGEKLHAKNYKYISTIQFIDGTFWHYFFKEAA